MTENPIDPSVYGELREATGAEFAAELVDTFLEDAPTMIAELQSALAEDDVDRFRRAAHSIKSNANVFGAHALAEPARQLEIEGMDGAGLRGVLDRLEAEYARAAAALRALRDG